jgi:peptidylprolyl isomerase
VLVQYTGVRWSDGKTFDSTWDKGGVPTSFATTASSPASRRRSKARPSVSGARRHPAGDGYGEGDINANDLKGETLVFVVDILGREGPGPSGAAPVG